MNKYELISCKFNTNNVYENKKLSLAFSEHKLSEVRRFLRTVPDCNPSPIVSLTALATYLKVKGIYIKDEGNRGTLKSFKILGATYAISKYICKQLNININDVNFYDLGKEDIKNKIGDLTFTTCSDGNHGRAVAWVANKLGFTSIIYLNKGTSEERVTEIRSLGAEAVVTEMNYDDTVRYANKKAIENGWVLVQDTSFDGYEEIPLWIMQGYATMAFEALEQVENLDRNITHILLQAGVGAMAGGTLGCISNYYNGNHPKTIIVEPHNAACMLKSAYVNSLEPQIVIGELHSIMAGLACGEPIKEGWQILRNSAYAFLSCSDEVSARAMRILGNPLPGDKRIISGESGAVTLGVIYTLMESSAYKKIREGLGINEDSEILLFSTEGDTAPKNYYDIVWNGKYQV